MSTEDKRGAATWKSETRPAAWGPQSTLPLASNKLPSLQVHNGSPLTYHLQQQTLMQRSSPQLSHRPPAIPSDTRARVTAKKQRIYIESLSTGLASITSTRLPYATRGLILGTALANRTYYAIWTAYSRQAAALRNTTSQAVGKPLSQIEASLSDLTLPKSSSQHYTMAALKWYIYNTIMLVDAVPRTNCIASGVDIQDVFPTCNSMTTYHSCHLQVGHREASFDSGNLYILTIIKHAGIGSWF